MQILFTIGDLYIIFQLIYLECLNNIYIVYKLNLDQKNTGQEGFIQLSVKMYKINAGYIEPLEINCTQDCSKIMYELVLN